MDITDPSDFQGSLAATRERLEAVLYLSACGYVRESEQKTGELAVSALLDLGWESYCEDEPWDSLKAPESVLRKLPRPFREAEDTWFLTEHFRACVIAFDLDHRLDP